eukprot:Gb_40172 [translate_table: standard]
MKGRSIQLKEGHQHHEEQAIACILWDWHAKHLITAGADSTILIHSCSSSSKPITLRHHKKAITALAINPNVKHLASGSLDHSVKLYTYPAGEFQSNVTRFSLPLRSLAFNKSGELLAAAGDDEGIKLISTIDSSIARVLKGHNGPVISLAFDPKNELLASADSTGTVIFWELSSGKSMQTLTKVAPDTDLNPTSVNQISWRPDGEMLAVPGRKNEVSMYDRDTREKLFSLKGGHKDIISFLAWSPNGKYIATSGVDCQVLIWDADKRQDIDRQRFENQICSLAWKPNGNALAIIDVFGKFGVWESAVASHMKSPVDNVESYESTDNDEPIMAKYEEDLEASFSGSLAGIGDESDDEMGRIPRRKLQKKPSVKVEKTHEENNNRESKSCRETLKLKSNMQAAFQPGATPVQSGKRSFLAYNMLGSIITFENDGFAHIEIDPSLEGFRRFHPKGSASQEIYPRSWSESSGLSSMIMQKLAVAEALGLLVLDSDRSIHSSNNCSMQVDFHDTGKGFRVPSMTDYFGFTMASLSENGSVFASPQKDEKNPSTLMYRPFSSWANNSEWSMRFPIEEEVKAIALGSGWVAAVTNLNYLRIFSEGGLQEQGFLPFLVCNNVSLPISGQVGWLCEIEIPDLFATNASYDKLVARVCILSQKFVLCLDGPVVTAAGHENFLAVATHASNPFLSGEQVLDFALFNVSDKTRNLTGRLPLSPGSHLTWLGFSEEGLLSSYDSKGILRVFTKDYNGCWVPLFSAERERKLESESFWMVGLNSTQFFCVVCKSPDTHPQVNPKPVLSVLNLSLPLACSDLGADDLENEYLRGSLLLSETLRKVEETATCGSEAQIEEDNIFKMEAALDRCLLRLIANCCKGDKLVRATELATLLSLDKSLNGAIKLVTAMKLPILAERLNAMLEEKMLHEKIEMPACNKSTSDAPYSSMPVHMDTKKALYKANTNDNPLRPCLEVKPNHSSPVVSKQDTRIDVNPDTLTREPDSVPNNSRNSVILETQPVLQNGSIQKPSNPFAKASNSANQVGQSNASLLNSIMQMKNPTENEGKRKERTGSGRLPSKPAKQAKT